MMQLQQYPQEKQYWEQNHSERVLAKFEKEVESLKSKLENNEGKPLTSKEKDRIVSSLNVQLLYIKQVGDIEARVTRFRNPNPKMVERELRWEKHSSTRLGKNLRLAGNPRPDKRCQAHAIIAGNDPAANGMRGMLAVMEIRVDDAINGVWLPGYEIDIPHWSMPNSVCHAWLNHDGYHAWLAGQFGATVVQTKDKAKGRIVIAILQKTAIMLQSERHNIPKSAIQTTDDTKKRNKNKL